MTWETLLSAALLETLAFLGLFRHVLPLPVAGAAHAAAALVAAVALASAVPRARGRARALWAALPGLIAPPVGLILVALSGARRREGGLGGDPFDPGGGEGAGEPANREAAAMRDAGAAVDALRFGDRAARRAALEDLRAIEGPEALTALRAAAADRDPEVSRLARAGLAAVEDRLNRSIVALKEEIRRHPDSAIAHAALGDHYAEYGDLGIFDASTRRYYLELAVKAYAHALKLSAERLTEVFLSIGRALLALGRHKVALAFFDRAVAASPDDARPLILRAEALLALGHFERIRRDSVKALEIGPREGRLREVAEFWATAAVPCRPPPLDLDAALDEIRTPPGGIARTVAHLALAETAAATGVALAAELTVVLKALASPEALRRDEAFHRLLAYTGDEAIACATRLVGGAPEIVRLAYCRYLGRAGGPIAIRRLGLLLSAPEEAIRREAAAALDRLEGPARTEALLDALERGTAFARAYAASVLGRAGEGRAVRPLIANLGDPRIEVRESAIRALRRVGDPAAVRPLGRLLADPRLEVRIEVVLALGDIGHPKARRALEKALRDESARVRQAAVFALARSLGAAAAGTVARALREDEDSAVRQEAARRLGGIGASEAAAALIVAAATDRAPAVRLAARLGLDAMPARSLRGPLVEGLADADARVRHASAVGLGRLGDPRALDPLAEALARDPNPEVRAGVAAALGRLALGLSEEGRPLPAEAVSVPLEAALADGDERVAAAAAAALGRLISADGLEAIARQAAARELEAAGREGATGERAAETGRAAGERAARAPGAGPIPSEALLELIHEAARRLFIPDPLTAFARRGLASESASVRYRSALALGRTGRRDVLEPLLALAAREEVGSIRRAAVQAAAKVLDGDPFPLLDGLARDDLPRRREEALIAALAAVVPRPGLGQAAIQRLLGLAPALERRGLLPGCERDYLAFFRHAPREVAMLVSGGPGGGGGGGREGGAAEAEVAAESARVMGRLGTEGVPIAERGELREALASVDDRVRRAAARALGELRDHDAVTALVALAGKDPSPAVAAAARDAVALILRVQRGEPCSTFA